MTDTVIPMKASDTPRTDLVENEALADYGYCERSFADMAEHAREQERALAIAERIADVASIELIRSCTVLAVDGDDWRSFEGENLEPELTYAIRRGLVERNGNDDGLLRFTELAWQRADYDQMEPLETACPTG